MKIDLIKWFVLNALAGMIVSIIYTSIYGIGEYTNKFEYWILLIAFCVYNVFLSIKEKE